MGYLQNTTIEIDCILTNRGKELLSKGSDSFKITQFALADDEIDYRLWNPDHNLGSAYYGEMIENMPLLEATPNETQIMKYKLVTLSSLSTGTTLVPRVDAGYTEIILSSGQEIVITPTTVNSTETANNDTAGYTAILDNSAIATLTATALNSEETATSVTSVGATSVTMIGSSFKLTAKKLSETAYGTLTIEGNETGGSVTINITVNAYTS